MPEWSVRISASFGRLQIDRQASSATNSVALFPGPNHDPNPNPRTLEGSLSVREARRSPAVMMLPVESRCLTAPLSVALSGMIIFMASTST